MNWITKRLLHWLFKIFLFSTLTIDGGQKKKMSREKMRIRLKSIEKFGSPNQRILKYMMRTAYDMSSNSEIVEQKSYFALIVNYICFISSNNDVVIGWRNDPLTLQPKVLHSLTRESSVSFIWVYRSSADLVCRRLLWFLSAVFKFNRMLTMRFCLGIDYILLIRSK